jgi:hypothetical protein
MNTMSTQHELPTLVVLNGYLARVLLAHQGSSEMVAEFVIEGAPAPDWNGCHQDRFSVRLLADLIGFARRLGTVAAAQVGNSGEEHEVPCPFHSDLLEGQPYAAWTDAYWGERMTHFEAWTVARRDAAELLQAVGRDDMDRTIQWMPGCMVVMDRTIHRQCSEEMDRTVHALAA